ncbi:MAG: hypothetical protein AAGA74_18190 [Pseudomonadota bacterium]
MAHPIVDWAEPRTAFARINLRAPFHKGGDRPWVGAENALPWGGSGAARRSRRGEVVMSNRLLNTFLMSVILVFLGLEAHAQSGRDITERTIEACLTSDLSAEDLEQRLETVGWLTTSTDQLTAQQLRSWAAMRLSEDMSFGPKSNIRWQEAWERAQKNAQGLKRLVVTDDSSSDRYFAYRESATLLIVSISQWVSSGQVLCRFVATPRMAENSIVPIVNAQPTKDMPPLIQMRPQIVSSGDLERNFSVSILRKEAISEILEDKFEYIAYVTTWHSVSR